MVLKTCDRRGCNSRATSLIEGGIYLCRKHEPAEKKYVCKHCGVQVISKEDVHPVLGHEHKKCCPRRKTHG